MSSILRCSEHAALLLPASPTIKQWLMPTGFHRCGDLYTFSSSMWISSAQPSLYVLNMVSFLPALPCEQSLCDLVTADPEGCRSCSPLRGHGHIHLSFCTCPGGSLTLFTLWAHSHSSVSSNTTSSGQVLLVLYFSFVALMVALKFYLFKTTWFSLVIEPTRRS